MDRRPDRAILPGYDPKEKIRPILRLPPRARVQRAGAGRRRGRNWECRMRISFASNTEGARGLQVRWVWLFRRSVADVDHYIEMLAVVVEGGGFEIRGSEQG